MVWVALEYCRAHLLGFPWLFLAHSQYRRIWLIQIADLTGQYGVSFAVAMVNGVIVEWVLARWRGRKPLRRRLRGAVVTACVLACLLGYGAWRVGQGTQSPGPVVGIVQQAIPTRLVLPKGDTGDLPGEAVQTYLDVSTAFEQAGCDLVVWPETVLPSGMNEEVWQLRPFDDPITSLRAVLTAVTRQPKRVAFSNDSAVRNEMWEYQSLLKDVGMQVELLSRALGCPVLMGGGTIHPPDEGQTEWLTRNSALWYEGRRLPKAVYSKRHPVPFSERVPFSGVWPWLHRTLRTFVPPTMAHLDPGREWVRFDLDRPSGRWRVGSPICYEGTFARLCRRIVVADGQKQADLLANISNDGWFVRWGADKRYGLSTEHAQHLVAYCFRAVENRVPVIRSVNTGISASIDSNGRIVALLGGENGYREGSHVQSGLLLLGGGPGEGDRLVTGPQVLVDSRRSVYSLIGDVFAIVVSIAALGMVGWILATSRRAGRPKNDG
ncbi:MAG: apolipoprotein N-acyltransferase [Planctomycetota bacterium]